MNYGVEYPVTVPVTLVYLGMPHDSLCVVCAEPAGFYRLAATLPTDEKRFIGGLTLCPIHAEELVRA